MSRKNIKKSLKSDKPLQESTLYSQGGAYFEVPYISARYALKQSRLFLVRQGIIYFESGDFVSARKWLDMAEIIAEFLPQTKHKENFYVQIPVTLA